MKKKFILICCLMLFSFVCSALGNIDCTSEAEKKLLNNNEVVSVEKKWNAKLGTHYLINLTENRILEFDQITPDNGGGKYACLKRIGEFELRETVRYINEKGETLRGDTKDAYGDYIRFSDLSNESGLKIETMYDAIDNYDNILAFVKKIANEQYISCDYVYKIDTGIKDRKAIMWVNKIHDYFYYHWHGSREDDNNQYYEILYGNENWRETLNDDLPKIRKSLCLEN